MNEVTASDDRSVTAARVDGSGLVKVVLIALLLIGGLIRLALSGGAGIVPDRDYRSLLIARSFYFGLTEDVPEWRREVAATSSARQESLELRVTEAAVAGIYRLIGGESIRAARLTTGVIWLVGAIPLFLVARRIGGGSGGLFSTAYYLLVPIGILLSVSFLPEALMITLLLFGLLAMVRHHEQPSMRRLLVAAAVAALAILVKPVVVFVIGGAFVALVLSRERSLTALVRPQALTYAVVALLPGVLYYGHGIVAADYLRWKIGASFAPQLLATRSFWEGWLISATSAAGLAPIVLALFGFQVAPRGWRRHLLLGLSGGYVLFCLLFNYFTRFAPHYHSQLVILVALAIGPVAGPILSHLGNAGRPWATASLTASAVALILVMSVREAADGRIPAKFVGHELAAEIGERVHHSTRVSYVAYTYGLPLEYHGELAGEAWPRPLEIWPRQVEVWPPGGAGSDGSRSIQQRLARLGFTPEYFVITNFGEYERHHADLRAALERSATLVAREPDYLIYQVEAGALGR